MSDYSHWMKQVTKYYPKWEKAQEKTSPTGKRVTAPRKCGFCRATDHTRRDCPEMATIYKDLLQANRNYRQSLYDTFVVKAGLGVGAVVKIQEARGYYQNKDVSERLATVESINMDTANLFLTRQNYDLDNDYKGELEVKLVGGDGSYYNSQRLILKEFADSQGRYLAKGQSGYYQQQEYLETIAPSKTPLDPEWVSRDADAFEWLLKKRTKEWLVQRNILSIIDEWK
jgi:hypothetical protein